MNFPPEKPYRFQEPVTPINSKKRISTWWPIPVIVVCIGLLIAAWVFAEDQFTTYEEFNAKRATVDGNIFHGPVYIDGIPLAGMSMDDARQLLAHNEQAQAQSFELTLTAGDLQWRISSQDVPMQWNTESLLEKAYMVGRVGTLEQRYHQLSNLTAPMELSSEFTYDKSAVRTLVNTIAEKLTVEPTNAAVVAFDATNRTFAYSDETPGQTIDSEALYSRVIEYLDNGNYGSTLPVEIIDVQPTVTRAALEANYTRIATYTTNTTDDSNRNTNIELAAHAINGKMIPPSDTFSFNETTGQRTREKGYLEAGAIENGRTVQEIGGGICQVSSTLFNALARANCEIVKRKPHAWPSDYVPRGEDATVDWPNLDLVMRNPSDAPMFITASYSNQTVTVDIYGLSLGDGMSIELESETTYTKEPSEVIYTYDDSLPVGTQPKLLKKPRTGYSVQTYKIWMQNGEEVSREKFYTSDYKVINEEYVYNDGNPPPETVEY